MKKSVVFLGLMMAGSVIFAQRKFDPQAMAAKQTERMKTELALNDDQYASVKSINEDFAGRQQALQGNSALTREDKVKQMKTLGAEKNDAIKKVLTADQNTKWEAYRAKQREQRKRGRGHRS
jgi:periplasmic protein CpxP/Spy